MAETKFQNVVFTAMMAFFMVFGMTVYTIAIKLHELSYAVFAAAIKEMWIEYIIVFLLVLFVTSRLAAKLAFRIVDPKSDKPIIVTITMQCLMVAIMVPTMTLIVNFIHNGFTANWLTNWLAQWAVCLPMAFFWQICYAGPVVRFLFRKIFRKN